MTSARVSTPTTSLHAALRHNALHLCGIDEAGRGALAGPVCAAAVQLGGAYPPALCTRLNDSKALTPTQRTDRAHEIVAHAHQWAVSWATHIEIDQSNILAATMCAMQRAYVLLCGECTTAHTNPSAAHSNPHAAHTNPHAAHTNPHAAHTNPHAAHTNPNAAHAAHSNPHAAQTNPSAAHAAHSNPNAANAARNSHRTSVRAHTSSIPCNNNGCASASAHPYNQNTTHNPHSAQCTSASAHPYNPHGTQSNPNTTHNPHSAQCNGAAIMSAAGGAYAHRPALTIIDGPHVPDGIGNAVAVIRADATIAAVQAASILAKTFRDAWMQCAHNHFSDYGFNRHKGYPTAVHRAAVIRYGHCPIHRRSFRVKA